MFVELRVSERRYIAKNIMQHRTNNNENTNDYLCAKCWKEQSRFKIESVKMVWAWAVCVDFKLHFEL